MPPLSQLVDAHANARDRLDNQALAAIRSAVMSFDSWYSDAKVRNMAAQVVLAVETTQRATANVTNAFLTRIAQDVVGKSLAAAPLVDPGTLREGVDHVEVYERLGSTYRYAASQGASPAEAQAASLARGLAMGQMDNLLAYRGQIQSFAGSSDLITGYRRILHPELSRHGSCGLCAVATDQVYRSEDLMPIHERCHCGVSLIARGKDPGRDLNEQEFKDIYGEAGSTSAKDLAKVRVQVHQHGELGPVLRVEKQHFRTPEQVAASRRDRVPGWKKPTKAELDKAATEDLIRAANERQKAVQAAREAMAARSAKAATDDARRAAEARAEATMAARRAMAEKAKTKASTTAAQDRAKATQAAREAMAAKAKAKAAAPTVVKTAARRPVKRGFTTPKIDALPRRTVSQDVVKERLDAKRNSNPGYGGEGYNINCIHVVATHEMRRRGYAVKATPLPKELRAARGRGTSDAVNRWRYEDGKPVYLNTHFKKTTDHKELLAMAEAMPVGARAWVQLQWKNGGGHIFNIERTEKGVEWLESQVPNMDASRYLSRGVSFQIGRVDNLVPTDDVMEFMEPMK